MLFEKRLKMSYGFHKVKYVTRTMQLQLFLSLKSKRIALFSLFLKMSLHPRGHLKTSCPVFGFMWEMLHLIWRRKEEKADALNCPFLLLLISHENRAWFLSQSPMSRSDCVRQPWCRDSTLCFLQGYPIKISYSILHRVFMFMAQFF